MAAADQPTLYVIVRMDGTAMEKTDIHSIWPDAGAALTARERIYSGEDTADGGGYLYEVVPVAVGERLDPAILRKRVDSPHYGLDPS